MQLIRLSAATSLLLINMHADDYMSIQYLYYNEVDGRITVSSPSIEINKEFGSNTSFNLTGTYDAISGASPTYYDASSGASSKAGHKSSTTSRRKPIDYDLGRGPVDPDNISYGNLQVRERRNAAGAILSHRFGSQDEIRAGVNWSLEYDLYLYAGSVEYRHYLDPAKNRSLALGMAFEYHANLVPCGPYSSGCDASSGSSKQIDSQHYNSQIAYSQLLTPQSYATATLFYLPERGYLTNSYKNIVRHYNTQPIITNENRPSSRNAGGLSLEYVTGVTPEVTLHTGYRYYIDDWHMQSHTPYIKMYDQITPDVRLELGYRYYRQSAAYFYNAEVDAFTDETYASSDERLSTFNAFDASIGLKWHMASHTSLNFSYSHYDQSTGLIAHTLISGITVKF